MKRPRGFLIAAVRTRKTMAFTLAEMLISMGASVIILGGLMMGSIALQKSLVGSQRYAESYSDQRRLIDFIARDLRRSVAVAATDGGGIRRDLTSGTVLISGSASLILSLPGYYRSNLKGAADFDQSLDIVGTEERLDYGSSDGLAPVVEVSFRKDFVAAEGCICFVRKEAGVDEVVVRAADNLFIEVTVSSGAQNASMKAWFRAPYSVAAPLVSTYDRLLLRNPPLTLRP
jgi:hypothetical protein